MCKVVHDNEGRVCSCCAVKKDWECFSRNSTGFMGRRSDCKECCSLKVYLDKELEEFEAEEIKVKNQSERKKTTKVFLEDRHIDELGNVDAYSVIQVIVIIGIIISLIFVVLNTK